MKKILLFAAIACLSRITILAQITFTIYQLDPAHSSTLSYAVQTNNLLDCHTQVREELGGGQSIRSFKVGFYLSADTTISPDDLKIGDYPVSCMDNTNLSCNTTSVGQVLVRPCSVTGIDLTAPGIPAGTYYIGTYVDYQDQITELTKDDNGWAFRNNAGFFTRVFSSGPNVGIATQELKNDLEKEYVDGHLTLKSVSKQQLTVELYTLDGRQVLKQKGSEITLPGYDSQILLLRVSTAERSYSEKIIL